jgi:glycosyltransferase involved in cell wall biosynthesis
MSKLATIVIIARNAAHTIERTMHSAMLQGDFPIILVDDFCADDTVTRAKAIGADRLRIVMPERHMGIGSARQAGLSEVLTPFGVWLDADDEMLPGRVERLLKLLQDSKADICSDEVELYDGPTSVFRRILKIPEFLMSCRPPVRLFERNYLPGIGVIGFRTEFAKRIGYDYALDGAEDIDFILRAIAARGHIELLPVAGYRQYTYPESMSRRIDNQRAMYGAALAKHDYTAVNRLYLEAGLSRRIAVWGLISMALFRNDHDIALRFLSEAESLVHDPSEVLDPEVCTRTEQWRLQFHLGTTLLQMGKPEEAIGKLETAERKTPTAEGANNLGVALRSLGDFSRAEQLFQMAAKRLPGYFDAERNLSDPCNCRITTHSIRSIPFRDEYLAQRWDAN